ncbi:acyl-CoA dehydrogenase family protein [Streptomyces sp. NPDC017520]|uniref:acyl-CoA dehydrogenase family protein n=1 Tax=Streptomyces sp. NPDC017520 TaxID=3364998 RepID=UPI0037A5B0B2
MTRNDRGVIAVLDEVTALVPVLRESGIAGEERRWIPDENIELLEKAGVFRIAVPRRFGGLGVPVADQAAVLNEIARADSATGWVSMIWVSSSWVPSLFPEQAQEEVYAGGTVRVSTGFTPSGTLTAGTADGDPGPGPGAPGDYTLDGSWKWISGSQGADWAVLAALLTDPDGTPVPHAALVPFSALSVADDWYSSAGAGTGSSTVTAVGVPIPAHRVLPLADVLAGGDYAFVPYFMAQGAAAYIGMAKGAYERFLERLPGRGITYTSWTDQAQSPVTQIQVAVAANKIEAADALQERWLRRLQEHADAGTQPDRAERAAARGRAAYAVQLAKEAVDELFEAGGASVILRDEPLQRFHRDIRGLSLHALFTFTTNQEVHGRAILGLAPDTAFL